MMIRADSSKTADESRLFCFRVSPNCLHLSPNGPNGLSPYWRRPGNLQSPTYLFGDVGSALLSTWSEKWPRNIAQRVAGNLCLAPKSGINPSVRHPSASGNATVNGRRENGNSMQSTERWMPSTAAHGQQKMLATGTDIARTIQTMPIVTGNCKSSGIPRHESWPKRQ